MSETEKLNCEEQPSRAWLAPQTVKVLKIVFLSILVPFAATFSGVWLANYSQSQKEERQSWSRFHDATKLVDLECTAQIQQTLAETNSVRAVIRDRNFGEAAFALASQPPEVPFMLTQYTETPEYFSFLNSATLDNLLLSKNRLLRSHRRLIVLRGGALDAMRGDFAEFAIHLPDDHIARLGTAISEKRRLSLLTTYQRALVQYEKSLRPVCASLAMEACIASSQMSAQGLEIALEKFVETPGQALRTIWDLDCDALGNWIAGP